MKEREINGFLVNPYKILIDNIGSLDKSIKVKRLEQNAHAIRTVLNKYNKDDNDRTMMFKLIRQPVQGTTTRGKHKKNVADIAVTIAECFEWLSPEVTRIMAENHDTGHTFLGHSGEWWISKVNNAYGLPYYVHNATGTRKLEFNNNIYVEVEDEIKKENPDIDPKTLSKIKRDLWLIIDGVLSHNGEKSEYSYFPDFSKTKKRFLSELTGCYIKKGFDRTILPATAEGSLMRLCDKISYISFDLVDIFRNGCNIQYGKIGDEDHDFYAEYEELFKELDLPEGSFNRLKNECKTEEDYDNFAREIQDYFILDVIKNTKRNNIRMSPKVSKIMHGIRDLNNAMMVNYTVMKEDHEAYVPAIEKLMLRYGEALIQNNIISADNNEEHLIDRFNSTYNMTNINRFFQDNKEESVFGGFAEFVKHITPEDFNFTVETCEKSMVETIDNEICNVRKIAQEIDESVLSSYGKLFASIEDTEEKEDLYKELFKEELAKAYGEKFYGQSPSQNNKDKRLDSYMDSFIDYLAKGYSSNSILVKGNLQNPITKYRKYVWLNKTSDRIKAESLSFVNDGNEEKGILPLYKRVAMDIGAQYIASLNDREFFELIQSAKLITPEQAQSLQRPYSAFDFRSESQQHSDWSKIARSQREATSSINRKTTSWIDRFNAFLGRER